MTMDLRFGGYSGSMKGIPLGNQSMPFSSDQNLAFEPTLENTFAVEPNFEEVPYFANHPLLGNELHEIPSSTLTTSEEDPHEDCDFSDAVLKYISQMLMEEDMEDRACMLQESLDLQAAEKSFYEVIGQKYPPSPQQNPSYVERNSERPDYFFPTSQQNYITNGTIGETSYSVNSSWLADHGISQMQRVPASYSSVGSCNSIGNVIDGFQDSPDSPLQDADVYGGSQSVWQFRKGIEAANRFIPRSNEMMINFGVNEQSQNLSRGEPSEMLVKMEMKEKEGYSTTGLRGKKNPHRDGLDIEEERSSKQAANFPDPIVRTKMFDTILLHSMGEGEEVLHAYRKVLKDETRKQTQPSVPVKGSTRGKGRVKKKPPKKEVIDLRTLLIHCAQAVASDDRRNGSELLKQIRKHAYPYGDGNQRLAHYLADGLEARLAGTGSHIYRAFVSKKTVASDYLKAYHLYLASCPFTKISNFVSNKMIQVKAENAMRVHVIDFGILYGFQWPTLIQRIAGREGGPPKLRITGVEFPQPGFRPAAGVEETGRRLADYARTFNVQFEYDCIAKNWDSIRPEDFKIDKDDFLVVNCLYRGKNLHDETVVADSSRTKLLNLIRRMNPDLFIHGIVNGAYSVPFFVTRFREVLFHFSALFDMLEANVPRENHERMLIEREIFGKQAMNVIACEGWERVERPETYKQWQVRDMRAGFSQLVIDRELKARAEEKVKENYHKDFLFDEDNKWLLLGWKGRIIFAISCWKPTE